MPPIVLIYTGSHSSLLNATNCCLLVVRLVFCTGTWHVGCGFVPIEHSRSWWTKLYVNVLSPVSNSSSSGSDQSCSSEVIYSKCVLQCKRKRNPHFSERIRFWNIMCLCMALSFLCEVPNLSHDKFNAFLIDKIQAATVWFFTSSHSSSLYSSFWCLVVLHSVFYLGTWYVGDGFSLFIPHGCDWPWLPSVLWILRLPLSVVEVFGDARGKAPV